MATVTLTNGSDDYTDPAGEANEVLGLDGNDTLRGQDLNDTLDGGAGADSLLGGAGGDTYLVDDAGDTITEAPSSGTDFVRSSISFTLPPDVENLTLTGTADLDGTGNVLANLIVGNSGDNVLNTGARGRAQDTLQGGRGDDTYLIRNNVDNVLIENAGEGIDTVIVRTGGFLPDNVENLIILPPSSQFVIVTGGGRGNALDNTITGSLNKEVISGLDGDDTLKGMAGEDSLSGGNGDDRLDGGTGADTLRGGTGDDFYLVGESVDQVIEAAGEGTDLVQARASFALSENVEHLTLVGLANSEGTGNALDNILTGNLGDNLLTAGDGRDTLAGGKGDDIVRGGAGSDALSGNFGADTLVGGSGDDTLAGGSGRDVLEGGAGADRFAFAAVSDTGLGEERDRIADFERGADRIDLARIDADEGQAGDQAFAFIGSAAFSGSGGELRAFQVNGRTVVEADTDGGGADLQVELTGIAAVGAGDFVL